MKGEICTRPKQETFLQVLRRAANSASAAQQDPWEASLSSLHGVMGTDGVERISTAELFDVLEVPVERRPAQTRRLARTMLRLGWRPIRLRQLNVYGCRSRLRGFARVSLEKPDRRATD